MKRILLLILMTVCVTCLLFACGRVKSDYENKLLPLQQPYGEVPDEGITIDGKNDESIWSEKNYFISGDTSYDVNYYVTTHFTQSGLYIYAFSEDKTLVYNARNNFGYNSHFYFIVAGYENVSIFNEAFCKRIRVDTSRYTMPTNFLYTQASEVYGTVNGKTQGFSTEIYISWEQLNCDKPVDKVKIYCAYMKVEAYGTAGTYIGNFMPDANPDPGTYFTFDKDGYVNQKDEKYGFGISGLGRSMSGGFEKTDNGLKVTGSGRNTAYYNIYSDKFEVSVNVSADGYVYNNSKVAKAGIIMMLNNGFYKAIMFDLRTENVDSENKMLSNRLFTMNNNPNKDQTRTNSVYDGVSGKYGSIKLTVIKDGAYFYYIVNDTLVYSESITWLQGKVQVGVYSYNAGCTFSDYVCADYSANPTGLNRCINRYAYRINANSTRNVLFENFGFNINKGKNVNVDAYVSSGKVLDKIYNNGEDITERVTNERQTLIIDDISADMNLSATVKDLTEYVTLKGKLTAPDGTLLTQVDIKITSDDKYKQYYAISGRDGSYEIKVAPRTEYKFTFSDVNYRDTSLIVTAGEAGTEKTLNGVANKFVVGGSVETEGYSYSSNKASWDMSRESESVVVLDLQDRLSGGGIAFTDVLCTNAVIRMKVRNVTNFNIGDYESDPGAGIMVRQDVDGETHAAIYNLYQAGYRVRPHGAYDEYLTYDKIASSTNFATTSKYIDYMLVRMDSYFYLFIDGNLVYSAYNPYIQGEAVYYLTYDSSYTLAVEYKDYSILVDDDAVDFAHDILYAYFDYDANTLQVDGIDGANYGLYKTTPTIRAKDLTGNAVAKITVNTDKYYVSTYNNSIDYNLNIEYKGGFAPVTVVRSKDEFGYSVSGKVTKASTVGFISIDGVRSYVQTDSEGNYALYLPAGEYKYFAMVDGYRCDAQVLNVTDANITNANIQLSTSHLGQPIYVSGRKIMSYVAGFDASFKEDTMRYSVRVNPSCNGSATYFDVTAEDIMISFKLTKISGDEPSPQFGVWTVTNNNPANDNSVRMLLSGSNFGCRDTVTGQSPSFPYLGLSGYNMANVGLVYDVVFIRRNNDYYMFVKLEDEKTFTHFSKYHTDTVEGVAAYGFTINASQSLSAEFFDYEYTLDTNEIDGFIDRNGKD